MSLSDELIKSRDGGSISEGPVGGRVKRVFDFVAALLLTVFFLPLLALIAVLVRVSGPGPVLFSHRRLGVDGKTFNCYKFRSMVPNSKEVLEQLLASDPAARIEWDTNQKLANDPRITPIGRVLRKTSMDELPQLLNVLVGDMSLVGPRPIVDDERRHYGAHYSSYTRARPGITGLWQVSGRSDTTYQTRVALDAEYVSRWSLLLDLSILMRTVHVVLFMRGSR